MTPSAKIHRVPFSVFALIPEFIDPCKVKHGIEGKEMAKKSLIGIMAF
jgi:hypothetical protein